MPFINADRDDFLQTLWGVLPKVPQNFAVLLTLGLVDKFLPLIKMAFYLFQFI